MRNPNANIEQEKLDAINKVCIIGDGYVAINEKVDNVMDVIGSVSYNDVLSSISVYELTESGDVNDIILDIGQIDSLDFVTRFNNLTVLRVVGNQLSDISAIKSLKKLTYLDLRYNPITDLSDVSELTNLTDLGLSHNNISDINALSGLTNLTLLHLDYNNISDISALSGLTNLTSLGLYDNNISDSDIEALEQALPNCNIFN